MTFDAIAHGKFDEIDYYTERPFKTWKRPELEERIRNWLALNPPRLELATLALDELKLRGGLRARSASKLFERILAIVQSDGCQMRAKRYSINSVRRRHLKVEGSSMSSFAAGTRYRTATTGLMLASQENASRIASSSTEQEYAQDED